MKQIIFSIALLGLAGCTELSGFSDGSQSVRDTSNVSYYPNDENVVSGLVQFREGNYGKAYASFKNALDVVPDDPQAWLGFAAASDMLGRFDKSDYAYSKLQPTIGNRVEYLNNYGYSMLLRGELMKARRYFLLAYEKDPSNPITANNLEMLRNSVDYPKRLTGDLKGI